MTNHTQNIESPGAPTSVVGRGALGFVSSSEIPSTSDNVYDESLLIVNNNNFSNPDGTDENDPDRLVLLTFYEKLTTIFSASGKGRGMFLLLRVCSKVRGCIIPDAIQTYIDNFFFPDFHAFIIYWQRIYDKRKPCFAEDPKTKEIIAKYNRVINGCSERHFIANIDDYFSGIARRSIKTNELLSTIEVYRRYHPRARRVKK